VGENIACPECGRLLKIPEQYHGREVRCPECKGIFVARQSIAGKSGITTDPLPPVLPAPRSAHVQAEPPAPIDTYPRRGKAWTSDDELERPREVGSAINAFRPSGALGVTVKVLLALNFLLTLLMLGSNYLQYILAEQLLAGLPVPQRELEGNEARQAVIGITYTGCFIITVIVFVMWFYRAHANLRPLGARHLTYTDGWAAGCWFVPFLNLVRPVQIAQEIWRHSDPSDAARSGLHQSGNSTLIGFWWAAWLISNVIANISMRMGMEVNSPQSLKSATVADIIADIASMIAAAFAIAVVIAIDIRQNTRALKLRPPTDRDWESTIDRNGE
jgi:hypothetical protein